MMIYAPRRHFSRRKTRFSFHGMVQEQRGDVLKLVVLSLLLCLGSSGISASEPESALHAARLAKWRRSHASAPQQEPAHAQHADPPRHLPHGFGGCRRIPRAAGTSAVQHPEGEDIAVYMRERPKQIPAGFCKLVDWLITGFVGGSAYLIEVEGTGQGGTFVDQKVFEPTGQSRQELSFSSLIPSELDTGRYAVQISVHDAASLFEVECSRDDAARDVSLVYRTWEPGSPETLIGKQSFGVSVVEEKRPAYAPQPLETSGDGTGFQHGARCSAARAEAIARQKPHHNSNCPSRQPWLDHLVMHSLHIQSPTIVSVGCHVGDDFLAQMQAWSHNKSFSASRFREAAGRIFPGTLARNCPERAVHSAPPEEFHSRPARGLCIEPMPANVRYLETCLHHLGYLGQATVISAALSSVPGSAAFPDGEMGREDLGLEHRGSVKKEVVVNVTTLDALVEAQEIERIDHLAIDTEGNDVRVLLGGLRTLASGKVRYLEFEYHQVGHWKHSSLEDAIDMLDTLNFDCYWSLNSGGARRLTGCWHESYDEKRWSNIACINRQERATHAYLERVAGF